MIEIKLTFLSYAAAAVAISKLAEGAKILENVEVVTTDGEGAGEPVAEPAKSGRRGKNKTAAADAAALPVAGAGSETVPVAAPVPATAAETSIIPTATVAPPAAAANPAPAATVAPPAATAAPAVAPTGDYATRLAAWQTTNAGKDALTFMRDNLQKIIDSKGVERVRAFMIENGHARITDYPAKDYSVLLAKIDAELAVPADPML